MCETSNESCGARAAADFGVIFNAPLAETDSLSGSRVAAGKSDRRENGWPWQHHFEDVVVGYNAYSPAGDVTAELVYVNYGIPEDYSRLADLGIDVRGKIAIARYGKVYRGVKNKVAAGQLQTQGWRPERTIILGGWDGEEYGQLGSTEWAEEFQQQLSKNAVAYLDLDSAGGGSYFTAAGVPSLDALLYDVTKEVEEPRMPGKSVFEDWAGRSGQALPPIDRLGGGYDYQVWIDHLGVPTIQMVFDYLESGNHHSASDDLYFSLSARQSMVTFAHEVEQAEAWESASLELEGRSASILAENPSIPRAFLACAQNPIPIPQLPTNRSLPAYIGDPATPNPVSTSAIPQNPFLAAGGNSNCHNDTYMSDAYFSGGPLGTSPVVLSSLLATATDPFVEIPCMAFDQKARMIGLTAFSRVPRLLLMDPVTLATLAASEPLGAGFVGGGYFYLDQNDHLILPSLDQILVMAVIDTPPQAPAFKTLKTYDLKAVVPLGDVINFVLPDFTGRLWFATKGGVVGVLPQPDTGVTATVTLEGEQINNSTAVDLYLFLGQAAVPPEVCSPPPITRCDNRSSPGASPAIAATVSRWGNCHKAPERHRP